MFSGGLHGKFDFKVFFVLFWVCCCSSVAASGVCREHIFTAKTPSAQSSKKYFLGLCVKIPAAIREDRTPNLLLMRYALATWEVRDLLLIPSFMFSESAVIKRPPLAATARRAGWVGCNIALNRVPAEARIAVVTTFVSPRRSGVAPDSDLKDKEDGDRHDACPTVIVPPEEMREKFRRVKPLKDISVTQRGWTLDVLNIMRRLIEVGTPRCGPRPKRAQDSGGFTAGDIAARCPYQRIHDRRRLRLHP